MSQASRPLRGCIALTLALAACGGEAPSTPSLADASAADVVDVPPPPPALRILVDGNRDGVVDDRDFPHRASFDGGHGASFLANLDDDDSDHVVDSADEIVNGDDDARDLARVRVPAWTECPEDAVGQLSVEAAETPGVRLYRNAGGAWTVFDPATQTLSAAELRAGVELGIESRGFPTPEWDGTTNLALRVTQGGVELRSDRAVMRVAPWVISSSLDPTIRVFGPEAAGFAAVQYFTDDLVSAVSKDVMDIFLINTYRAEYRTRNVGPDVWMQDIMEFGWTAIPAPDSAHHGMHVVLRTPAAQRPMATFTERELLGPNMGYMWHRTSRAVNGGRWDPSLDSFGNLELLPPYRSAEREYPMGRILLGSVERRHPDRALRSFLDGQRVQGAVFELDTSWLHVGHVDEFLSFIPADTPRGWRLVVASPRRARALFTDYVARSPTNGSRRIFEGMSWYHTSGPREGQPYAAQRTVSSLLADTTIMAVNQRVQGLIDTEVQRISEEVGLTEEDIVELPVLFWEVEADLHSAYMPGTVNLLFYANSAVMARPHGVIDGDIDIVEQANIDALAPYGINVRFAEQWDILHVAEGEVHCGTNALRQVPVRWQWWETL